MNDPRKKQSGINFIMPEQPTAADFTIQIQRFHAYSLFDTGTSVSCLTCHCYSMFDEKPGIQRNVHVKVTSADGSNLKSLGTAHCSIDLSSQFFHQHLTVCKNLFKGEIDWKSQQTFYLDQNHKLLTYAMTNENKVNAPTFSANCFEVHLITESKVFIPAITISYSLWKVVP